MLTLPIQTETYNADQAKLHDLTCAHSVVVIYQLKITSCFFEHMQ